LLGKNRTMSKDFRKIENVLRLSKDNDYWFSVFERKNALEIALASNDIDAICEMIARNTRLPLIYESGCGTGLTTTQICKYLSERGIERYKMIGHDVLELPIASACSRLYHNKNVAFELRSGSDYSDISDNSIDGIFSLNTMLPFLYTYSIIAADNEPCRQYLLETSRVLKETKPLVLTYCCVPLVLVKHSNSRKEIPFQIKLYKDHPCIRVFLDLLEEGNKYEA